MFRTCSGCASLALYTADVALVEVVHIYACLACSRVSHGWLYYIYYIDESLPICVGCMVNHGCIVDYPWVPCNGQPLHRCGLLIHRYMFRTCSRCVPWALYTADVALAEVAHRYALLACSRVPNGCLYYIYYIDETLPIAIGHILLKVLFAIQFAIFKNTPQPSKN